MFAGVLMNVNTPGHKKSVPDLIPERDQLKQDQPHVYDPVVHIFLKDGRS
jgi:hypothetical protein